MGGRNDRSRAPDGPGPGAYDYSLNPIKETAPGAKMGTAARGSNLKSDAPGPGQYNPADGKGGGMSFGKEARDGRHGGGEMPGPGQYNSHDFLTPGKNGKGISFGL